VLKKVIIAVLMIAVLFHSEESVAGAASGISYALSVLIPSLFPFMILSSAFSQTVKNKSPFLIFLLSVLGGYPVAAKCLENDDLSKNNASILIYTCVNPGISFMTVIVSKTLLQNSLLGLLVTLSVYISSFILFLVSYFIYKPSIISKNDGSFDLVECVSSSTKSIISMSFFVIAFSALEYLIFSFGIGDILYFFFEHLNLSRESVLSILSGSLEISSGITNAVTSGCNLWIICALLSFGGICVSFQIFSIIKDKESISKAKYYFYRVIHVVLSCIILSILRLFIKPDLAVIYTPDALIKNSASKILPASILLILTCVIFLLTLKNDVEITEKV